MKIAFIITRFSELGGAQVHVRDLAARLCTEGHAVHIISGDDGAAAAEARLAGAIIHIIPSLRRAILPWQDWRAIQDVAKILRVVQPDLLSCHSSKAGVVGRVAAFSCGIPAIFTAHGFAFSDTTSILKKLFYLGVELSLRPITHHVIAVSEYDRQQALRFQVCNPKQITTVHNGMPLTPVPTRMPKPAAAPVKIIMNARFGPQKDHATLAMALAELKKLNWQLDLIYGGGDATPTRTLVSQYQLQDRINFIGQIPNAAVTAALASADIFTLITNWEGLPRSIIEAMRARLPVIATKVAGVPELIDDGSNGYLVERGDSKTLANYLAALISNDSLRQQFGEAGRTKYEASFTFDSMLTATKKIYQQVTGKNW